MKTILPLLLIFLFVSQLFSQSFVRENKLWSTVDSYSYLMSGGMYPPSSNYIKFEQDTIIGSYTYKKVFSTTDFSMIHWDHIGFIREDSVQKVFLRDLSGNEGLIYDFMVNQGDTISFYNPLTTFSSVAVVDSIYQIMLGTEYFSAIEVRDTACPVPEIWTKRMGNLLGVLKGGYGLSGIMGWDYRLLCYFEDASLIYHNDMFPSCYYNTPFFAPVGAKWHYTERFAFSGDEDYIKFEVEKDTVVAGMTCKKITKRHKISCNDRPYTEFMFLDGNQVFFWDEHFNKFQMLYDFDANPGDSWFIEMQNYLDTNIIDSAKIFVDSITYTGINIFTLKKLYVTYTHSYDQYSMPYGSIIVEGIGDMTYMFNYTTAFQVTCDDNWTPGLRCYRDYMLGSYETGIAPSCEYYLNIGIDDLGDRKSRLKIHPNPARDLININIPDTDINGNRCTIQIFNSNGSKVYSCKSINASTKFIDISGLIPGTYLLKLITKQDTFSEILIVE